LTSTSCSSPGVMMITCASWLGAGFRVRVRVQGSRFGVGVRVRGRVRS
jgi:hypothetical protein